ncbi:membrane protein [soil metagenome]
MEGDAGSGQLNPDPVPDDAERREAEEGAQSSTVPDDAEPIELQEGAEPVADEDAQPARVTRSRLASRGWLVGVCATLVVLALAVATGGYFALRSHDDSESTARSEAAAMQAAKDCVIATQAPDASAMEASQRKIIECATGDFGAQATLYSSVLVDAYQASNAKVQVSNIRAAVERHNGDGSVDVLVALRVAVTNSVAQNQETGFRLRVNMAPDNGTYKIAKLDQVTK